MTRLEAQAQDATSGSGAARGSLDEAQVRSRLLEAAGSCIVRRGNVQFRMAEVAEEAGVARSTVYRYFSTRADLILGLLLSRVGPALEAVVRALPHPDDAARSIPDLILGPIGLVEGSPLNEALFSPESSPDVTALEFGSDPLVDAAMEHFGPLLERWQGASQLHDDLDVRDTVRWMHAISLVLLQPPWRVRTPAAKRQFLERYLVRALVPAGGAGRTGKAN
jgi:AcrR family transcriptional regulator